ALRRGIEMSAEPLSSNEWKRHAIEIIESLEREIDTLTKARREPIAVVGASCRLPGASDLKSFWCMLEQGAEGIRETPNGRWDVDTFYDPDPDAPGKTTARRGGFLDG